MACIVPALPDSGPGVTKSMRPCSAFWMLPCWLMDINIIQIVCRHRFVQAGRPIIGPEPQRVFHPHKIALSAPFLRAP